MDYIFTSLKENRLLHPGDTIALETPSLRPIWKSPNSTITNWWNWRSADENADWQYAPGEINKLANPAVKAFFLVNPSNPTSVAIQQDTLAQIADLVRTRRQDLIILTDDVYGTFVNDFRSLAAVAPYNTILVYSFSKYFGATGWRLGVIGIHEDNVFDKIIAALPDKDRSDLRQRYHTVVLEPDRMKL